MLKPADIVVVVVAAVAIGVFAAVQWRPAEPAGKVELRGSEGMVEAPLDRDARISVPGPLGDSIIEIRDGRARFAVAPCRHRVCIRAGWLANDGDFAACVPNRVTMRAVAPEPRYDAINH